MGSLLLLQIKRLLWQSTFNALKFLFLESKIAFLHFRKTINFSTALISRFTFDFLTFFHFTTKKGIYFYGFFTHA